MSDLKLCGAKNDREQEKQHEKAICSAVPHDFQSKHPHKPRSVSSEDVFPQPVRRGFRRK